MELLQFRNVHELALKGAKLCETIFMSSPVVQEGIILSGGNTPISMYDSLVRLNPEVRDNISIFFGDERVVPPDSGDSNYRAAGSMLRAIGFPEPRIYRIRTELGPEEAAEKYEADIRKFTESGGIFKIAFLGLSAQGVTASLLDRRLLSAERIAVPVKANDVNSGIRVSPMVDRVTLTPAFFEKVERIIFLVTGYAKRRILEKLLSAPRETIAGEATAKHNAVEIWADSDALG